VANEILVLAEHRQGKLRDVCLEMLSQAAKVAGPAGQVVAVLLGAGVEAMAETLARHADRVLYADNPRFERFDAEGTQRVLAELVRARKPALVLLAHSAQGAELAPALAVEAGLSLTSDVIDLARQEAGWRATRQVFQGKANADYALAESSPQLVTVREGSFDVAERAAAGPVEKLAAPASGDAGYKRLIEYLESEAGAVDITKSQVLVAVGRGIKEKKNLAIVEALAAALNADVCGSRVAIDAGWLPLDRQVGITGKVVKPKVYIAIGISGAFQHLAGMSGAKTIVAINKDRSAPIFSVADFAIVDDLFKVIPKLTEKVKALRGTAG
jgi:electron transfer flavoprotein alpha subunit